MPIHKEILDYNTSRSVGDQSICTALAQAIDKHLSGKKNSAASEDGESIECKIWHRHPVWFINGNPIVGYHTLKGPPPCVRLLFWSGRSFDESGLEPEGGFQTAGVRYTDVDQIVATDLKRWLRKSLEIQWDYKNIVKRKGKLVRLM